MNETETRAEHIDSALTASGWGVVEGSRIRREFPIAPGRIEDKGGSHPTRYYQDIAIERVMDAIAENKSRILFLADRNILADQAYNAFSAFPEDALVRIESGDIRKKGKAPKNGSLFFTIFQTFMVSGNPVNEVNSVTAPRRDAIFLRLLRIPAGLFRFHRH